MFSEVLNPIFFRTGRANVKSEFFCFNVEHFRWNLELKCSIIFLAFSQVGPNERGESGSGPSILKNFTYRFNAWIGDC